MLDYRQESSNGNNCFKGPDLIEIFSCIRFTKQHKKKKNYDFSKYFTVLQSKWLGLLGKIGIFLCFFLMSYASRSACVKPPLPALKKKLSLAKFAIPTLHFLLCGAMVHILGSLLFGANLTSGTTKFATTRGFTPDFRLDFLILYGLVYKPLILWIVGKDFTFTGNVTLVIPVWPVDTRILHSLGIWHWLLPVDTQ